MKLKQRIYAGVVLTFLSCATNKKVVPPDTIEGKSAAIAQKMEIENINWIVKGWALTKSPTWVERIRPYT